MINLNPVIIISGIFLLAMVIFDTFKGRKIPAILGTTGILACAFLVLWKNPSSMLIGILGFIFAYLLYEFGAFKGIADIKAIVLISLTLVSLFEFIQFMVIVSGLCLIYHLVLSKAFKIKYQEDIPLIPVFFLTWVILVFI